MSGLTGRRAGRSLVVMARLAVAGVIGSFVAPVAAGASPTGTTYVAMFGDASDYVTFGQKMLFVPATDTTVSIQGTASYLTLSVNSGSSSPSGSHSYYLNFAAPPGQTLAPGLYAGATRAPFRKTGEPGIDIYGDGRGCNEVKGSFTVDDIGVDGAGNVNRLSLTYESHCEGGDAAVFGEVKYQATGGDPALTVAPSRVGFPARLVGQPSTDVPVTVVNPGPDTVSVSSAALAGTNTADFAVVGDACSGTTVAAGARCAVTVRFTPTDAGARTARLDIADSTPAGLHSTDLGGTGIPGTSVFTLDSEPGDWVGAGQQLVFTPSNATISGSGSPGYVRMAAITPGYGHWFYADIAAPVGETLHVGTYTGATRAAFRQPGEPGIDISGDGRGCNNITGQFTVEEISFGPDGSLATFAASYEQRCEGWMPPMFGELRFRSTVPYKAIEIQPSSLSFGSTVVDTTGAPRTATFTSRGTPGLTFGTAAITGGNAGDFKIVADSCSGATVPTDAACSISVTMTPSQVGSGTATLNVPDDTLRGTHAIALSGTGLAIPTSTSLSSDANPSVFGQPVTFTAKVTASSGTASPDGAVTFRDGQTVVGTAPLSAGSASVTLSSLAVGTHTITAGFEGGSRFGPSGSSPLSQAVALAGTTTSVKSSKNPATPTDTLVFTATVSVVAPGACELSGWVGFYDGATLLGEVQVGPGGVVTMVSPGLAGGTHAISAGYRGNQNCAPSKSAVWSQVIRGRPAR
ncbi:MAG TPA: Ig-like domain repeat protein [Acidimicrobiales bacterium]|nr:Ig-like domain repeat protein [Acidimicrobiales bacterium]